MISFTILLLYILRAQHIAPTSKFYLFCLFPPHWEITNPIRFLLISFVSFVFSSYISFILSSRLEDQCFSIVQSQQGACHSPAPLYPYHHQSALFLKSLLVSSFPPASSLLCALTGSSLLSGCI